jgi:hypothetical protein
MLLTEDEEKCPLAEIAETIRQMREDFEKTLVRMHRCTVQQSDEDFKGSLEV